MYKYALFISIDRKKKNFLSTFIENCTTLGSSRSLARKHRVNDDRSTRRNSEQRRMTSDLVSDQHNFINTRVYPAYFVTLIRSTSRIDVSVVSRRRGTHWRSNDDDKSRAPPRQFPENDGLKDEVVEASRHVCAFRDARRPTSRERHEYGDPPSTTIRHRPLEREDANRASRKSQLSQQRRALLIIESVLIATPFYS